MSTILFLLNLYISLSIDIKPNFQSTFTQPFLAKVFIIRDINDCAILNPCNFVFL